MSQNNKNQIYYETQPIGVRTKIRFAGVVYARLYGYSVITDIISVLLQHWRVSEYSMITTSG